jgi:hypothetical protein
MPDLGQNGCPLPLQNALAAGHQQPQPPTEQKPKRENQAPDRKEKQGQNSGILGLSLQQPFNDRNGSEQPDRAPRSGW